MKKILVFCLFLCVAGSLSALDWITLEKMSFGIGAEANANTREGAAAGGVLSFDLELNKHFLIGLNATFSHNFDTVFTLEPRVFFRYNLPFKINGFFVQAELGTAVFFEDSKAYPAFSGGLAAGWRFLFNEKFYIEPYIRGGYPFIWGIGLTAGMSLSLKKESVNTGEIE